MKWFVYMLRSQNYKWYYVGSTNCIERRLSEHNAGKVTSTKKYLPFKIAFLKEFPTEKEARAYEKLLKDKRIEKENIIRKIEK